MSQAGYTVNSGAVALTSTVAKTLVNVIAATSKPIRVTEIGVSFDGVTSSAIPGLVELCTSTQAGAGTPGSSPTPLQIRGTLRASDATAGIAYSSEPTAIVAMKQWYIPQFNGVFVKQSPLGREEESFISGDTTTAVLIRVTTTGTPNCRALIEFEEG